MTQFNKDFFIHNRAKLSGILPDSIVVLTSNVALQQTADLSFPFRQESNFWYLTGFTRPDFVCAIDTRTCKTTIFFKEQNDYQVEWDGELAIEQLKEMSGVDFFEPLQKLEEYAKQAQKNKLTVCSLTPPPERIEPYGFYANPARRLLTDRLNEFGVQEIKDIRLELAQLRQVKQAVEISAIKEAIAITGIVLADVKKRLETFSSEKQIEQAITSGFYAKGAEGHAYEPIVAYGKNASILHYNDNNNELHGQGLLLLDVGAQVRGYAADISRTWSVGKPTARQKEIYKAVAGLQNEAMNMLKPGVYLKEYQEAMEKKAAKVLKALGKAPRQYPHGLSHFLGLDVHDAGNYLAPLVPGTVLTVEPGFYFSDEGIGVRIEDDVLITDTGVENLSEGIPKLL